MNNRKSYLSQQIRLISLATNDLFTDAELETYNKIVSDINELNKYDINLKKQSIKKDDEYRKNLIEDKHINISKLESLISSHSGIPRTVRLKSVLDYKKFINQETGEITEPKGVSWFNLKLSRKIAEFMSEESRALGLKPNEITFDKIIIKWKSLDLLRQLVLDGFYMQIENDDGSITTKHYHVMTASAGQLRTDKIQCISDEAWDRIKNQIECGMTWDIINKKGGINVNKLMAYTALPCSATDEWDFDIDKCIVIKDFEADVTGLMQYIQPDYSSIIGEQTVKINHCDGIGMMLPCVSRRNFMVRGPWLKGLLTSFDYLLFCSTNNVEPVLEDVWHQKHDLIREDIQVIFTESQLKLWKYYDSWDHYKQCFKENGCHLCRTNYEEDYIEDTDINYQMLQTLVDFTDDEIEQFTRKTFEKINGIAKDKESMLRVLGADIESDSPYKKALYIYPELLREAYSRETIKSVKKKWTFDAKSGAIKCKNKRLFAIPDMYAACEFWFMNIKNPKGLLADGEVSCKIYRNRDKIDILRSPHLYMEHAIRNVTHNQAIYDWFYTNGIYTSCHDLISRILQFDVDGDQLNCVADNIIISVAERNIEENHIIPLFYDAEKAKPEQLSNEAMFNGLKRAHDFSGIGQISNSLTKLWNKEHPDYTVAAWLAMYNNFVIDAAKTGKINSYENYPDVFKRIKKAVGGNFSKMPYFFQYSKNGRRKPANKTLKKDYEKVNNSLMNRICTLFDNIGNINMNYSEIPPFNWRMMLRNDNINLGYPMSKKIINIFCTLDDSNISNVIRSKEYVSDAGEKSNVLGYDLLKESIIHDLSEVCTLEEAYPIIVKYLFTGDNVNKTSHKQMFWRVFGDIAYEIIEENLQSYKVCEQCGMKIPNWTNKHECVKNKVGYFECVDCGTICLRINSKQCRCESCQKENRRLYINSKHRQYRKAK